MRRRALPALVSVIGLAALPAASAYAGKKNGGEAGGFSKQMPKDLRAAHALNRLTFGPRSGDADRVRAMGLKKWLDFQLHPRRIAANPKLDEKLKWLDSLPMKSDELVRNYPAPQIVRRMVAGEVPFPSDPDRRLLIQKVAARFERNQGLANPGPAGAPPALAELSRLLEPGQIRTLRTAAPPERLAAFEALPRERQDDIIAAAPGLARQGLFPIAPPELGRRIELGGGPAQVVANDLVEGKLLRAIYSNRQLEEVLSDFWFNHFNVYLDKGADHYLVTDYERDVIRPRVLGKFKDLLEATAKSPAMLFYLDNWQSAGPNAAARSRRGLNENYARELMELHTLGVDGGYLQKDVTEVARCFTGWTIRQPQLGGGFLFDRHMHDSGSKVVLGVTIAAGGGMEDGEKVLDILAHHPSTAHFISRQLAQRFVADDPPPALVDRMARTFLKTGGDLREVMKAMLASKEFWSVGAYRSKIKSPLEMVVSAVRAVDGEVDFASPLGNQVAQLGEPLYRKQEPTGYSNLSRQWANSAGLLARMNFALQLAENRMPGVKVGTANPAEGIELAAPDFQKH